MGNTELETGTDDLKTQETTYSVIIFPGKLLPSQYENMVKSQWMRTLRFGNDYFKLINSDDYYKNYERYIKILFQQANAIFRIAVLTDDHDVALGWSLVDGDKLHYVHVQHDQRNKGIGTMLVPKNTNTITHLTKSGMGFWNNKLSNAKFNPF